MSFKTIFYSILCIQSFLVYFCKGAPKNIVINTDVINNNDFKPQLWLTISAKTRSIEVSWAGARNNSEDLIIITDQEPLEFIRNPNLNKSTNKEFLTKPMIYNGFNESDNGSGDGDTDLNSSVEEESNKIFVNYKDRWLCNNESTTIKTVVVPQDETSWARTSTSFDYNLSQSVTKDTKCYGFWASYIDNKGVIYARTCIQAYPLWMNEMKSAIADFRIRDLFIPGTHDSGSYRLNFNPLNRETLVTKYSLTQDDDIRGQLMHGARYIDLRIGFYRGSEEKFFVNHGISKQRPLKEVLNQIIDFITETNEIVILDFQEFPVGFGKNLDVHKFLVHFLISKLENYLVDPILGWQVTLRDIWKRKRNIILSYDNIAIVNEFPSVLFHSVQQRWGDVRNLKDLDNFLREMNKRDPMRLTSRPVADMAELTPDTWGVITDKYDGLRKMADKVNHHITSLYMNELGPNANIIAVDFIRGTNIVEAALKWNSKKVIAFK